MITLHRFTEQNLHDCREELQSKTEELKSVLESSTIAENELREEATLRKRYVAKTLCCQNSMVTLKRGKWLKSGPRALYFSVVLSITEVGEGTTQCNFIYVFNNCLAKWRLGA